MMKLVTTYPFKEKELTRLRQLGYEVEHFATDHALDASPQTAQAEVVVASHRTLTEERLDRMAGLLWVQLPHVGIERLDMEYFRRRRILVTNARGALGMPLAEDILTKMLMFARMSPQYLQNQARHQWKSVAGTTNLSGKTLGIIGTGDIGGETAKRAKAMEMEVLGVNTKGRPVVPFDRVFATESLHEMLPLCDYVVLACPLTQKTQGMIGFQELSLMRPETVLINISRGGLIDEPSLLEALTSGHIKGAGLDVFVDEVEHGRLRTDSPFWDLPNVIITPHQGGDGDQFYQRFSAIFIANAAEFIQGHHEAMANLRDYDQGY